MNKKIISQLQLKGKKTISEKIWLNSLKRFYKSFNKNHQKFINKALTNIAPLLKTKQLKQKKKRVVFKEFPYVIKKKNRVSLALKFFFNKTKQKTEMKIHKKLTDELIIAAKNIGPGLSKKKSLYEYAFVKKKYFYYRWF
jgi:ribosomal protein S7